MSLVGFSSFGFAGSRLGHGARAARCLAAAAAAAGCGVFATCGAGAPAAAAAVPGALVWRASAAPWSGLPARSRFAARASAFVRALSAAPAPVLVCWPGCAAPAGLLPRRSWSPCGSGSWSEAALAVGLGVSVVLFLPAGVLPPAVWGAWSLVGAGPLSGGWLLPAASPQEVLI